MTSYVSAVKDFSHRPHLYSVYAPEKINIFEPFMVRIEINDEEYRKTVEGIRFGNPDRCGPSFLQRIGFEEYPLEKMEGEEYKYVFPKDTNEIEFYVSALNNGHTSVHQEGSLHTCSINLVHDIEKARRMRNVPDGVGLDLNNYPSIRLERYAFDFGIKNDPVGFTKLPKNTHPSYVFATDYIREEENLEIKLTVDLRDGTSFTYEELIEGSANIRGGVPGRVRPNPGLFDVERYNFELGDGYIGIYCPSEVDSYGERREENTYYLRCFYYVVVLTPVSAVTIDLHIEKRWVYGSQPHERDRVLEQVEFKKNEMRDLLLELGNDIYFESAGQNVDFQIEREEVAKERVCGDCGEGYVCNACDECVKEEDAVHPDNVEVRADVEIGQSRDKILNAIDQQSIFRVHPNIQFYDGNRRIDYCDIEEPGIEVFIIAEITNNVSDIYSGFTSGFVNDERDIGREWRLDLERGQERAVFTLAPSKRKKFFSEAEDIIQNINFTIKSKDLEIVKSKEVILEPPTSFIIDLNSRNNQVHQGSSRVLNVRVGGGTTPAIITKITLLGPGHIGLGSDEMIEDWILQSLSQGETIQVGYKAPEMGNFDIGSALNSLSMVELQKNAAREIFNDAVSSFAGGQVERLGELADAGRISQRFGYAADAYSAYGDISTIVGTPGDLVDIHQQGKRAAGAREGGVEAGWVETGAEWGVTGINALQTTVGLITFIPDRIPYVRQMSTQFDVAFSAATNIWKANFKYVADAERIDRAEELYFPTAILVTAQDISGWTTQEMYVFKIMYHQLN